MVSIFLSPGSSCQQRYKIIVYGKRNSSLGTPVSSLIGSLIGHCEIALLRTHSPKQQITNAVKCIEYRNERVGVVPPYVTRLNTYVKSQSSV